MEKFLHGLVLLVFLHLGSAGQAAREEQAAEGGKQGRHHGRGGQGPGPGDKSM